MPVRSPHLCDHVRDEAKADISRPPLGYNRGSPFAFKLGGGQVIKGYVQAVLASAQLLPSCARVHRSTRSSNPFLSWDEGLLDMCIGEKRTLTVPPEFGYGQRSVGPIPAGSTLSKYSLPPCFPTMHMPCLHSCLTTCPLPQSSRPS